MKSKPAAAIFSKIPTLDIKAEWLLNPELGQNDFLVGDARLTIVIHQEFTDAAEDFDLYKEVTKLLNSNDAIVYDLSQLGGVGTELLDDSKLLPGGYVVAQLTKEYMTRAFKKNATELVKLLERLSKASPGIRIQITSAVSTDLRIPPESTALQTERKPNPPLNKQTRTTPRVIMGIIDDGVRFAHERFRNKRGTRIEYFWDQTSSRENSMEIENATCFEQTILYGNEVTKQNIDEWLEEFALSNEILTGPSSAGEGYGAGGNLLCAVDEAALYRKYFPKSPTGGSITHGTHVLDVAAGASIEDDVQDRPIIAVQIPSVVTEDTSGTFLEHHVRAGIMYIVEKAQLLGGDTPVVINFSFGTFAGPHDGTSALERDIDALLINRPNVHLVLPAGNSHLTQCHARFKATDNQASEKNLNWRIQPDDQTTSWLHIWLPANKTEKAEAFETAEAAEIVVTPPGVTNEKASKFSLKVGADGGTLRILNDDDQVVAMVNQRLTQAGSARIHFCIAVHPTARQRTDLATAPAGVWKIALNNVKLSGNQVVDAWIERDDTAYGYRRRGRQSYFEDPNYAVYNDHGFLNLDDNNTSPIKRTGMLNALATGEFALVVGAASGSADGKQFRPADYTAKSHEIFEQHERRKTHGTTTRPDVLCVSDDSRIHRGTLAARALSGTRVALSGTSVAAPQAARLLADALSKQQSSVSDNEIEHEDEKGAASPNRKVHSSEFLRDKLTGASAGAESCTGGQVNLRMAAGVVEWDKRPERFPELRDEQKSNNGPAVQS